MSESDARSWMSCLGWGCLTVVVISVLGIGGCVAWVYQGGKGAHTVANTYLEAVDTGRYEDAFATLGPQLTEGRGLAELIAFEQAARAELGSCTSWATRGTSFNRENGRSVSQLRFVGECDRGPATVTLSLEEVDERWVIQDIRYNEQVEPAEPVATVCTGCGDELPAGAMFCPSCGAEVGAEPEPNPGSTSGAEEGAE